MNRLIKSFLPVLVGIVLFPVVLISGLNIWKTNSYEDAVAILQSLDQYQLAEIHTICIDLIEHADQANTFIETSPFDFMPIDFIRLSRSSCEVFLYKGPGKGVGYVVNKQSKTNTEFYWFNDFENWDRHPIELSKLTQN